MVISYHNGGEVLCVFPTFLIKKLDIHGGVRLGSNITTKLEKHLMDLDLHHNYY